MRNTRRRSSTHGPGPKTQTPIQQDLERLHRKKCTQFVGKAPEVPRRSLNEQSLHPRPTCPTDNSTTHFFKYNQRNLPKEGVPYEPQWAITPSPSAEPTPATRNHLRATRDKDEACHNLSTPREYAPACPQLPRHSRGSQTRQRTHRAPPAAPTHRPPPSNLPPDHLLSYSPSSNLEPPDHLLAYSALGERSYSKNPIKTGLVGQGELSNPGGGNYALDTVITRASPVNPWMTEVLLCRSITEDVLKQGRLALPGMLLRTKDWKAIKADSRDPTGGTPEESDPSWRDLRMATPHDIPTLFKKLLSENVSDEGKRAQLGEQVDKLKQGKHFWTQIYPDPQPGKVPSFGFCDDVRNTDDAWIQSVCWHVHIPMGKLCTGLDMGGVEVEHKLNLYQWHAIDSGDPQYNEIFGMHKWLIDRCVPVCVCGRRYYEHDGTVCTTKQCELEPACTHAPSCAPEKVEGPQIEDKKGGEAGEIHFVATDLTSQYVRAVVEKEDHAEKVFNILRNSGMREPRALVCVTGGAMDVDEKEVDPVLWRKVFDDGVVRAAKFMQAVVNTGGTSEGVMRYVGEAVARDGYQVDTLGIAAHGTILGKQKMTAHFESYAETLQLQGMRKPFNYKVTQKNSGHGANLQPNHQYFLLVDSGTSDFGSEVKGASLLRDCIVREQSSASDPAYLHPNDTVVGDSETVMPQDLLELSEKKIKQLIGTDHIRNVNVNTPSTPARAEGVSFYVPVCAQCTQCHVTCSASVNGSISKPDESFHKNPENRVLAEVLAWSPVTSVSSEHADEYLRVQKEVANLMRQRLTRLIAYERHEETAKHKNDSERFLKQVESGISVKCLACENLLKISDLLRQRFSDACNRHTAFTRGLKPSRKDNAQKARYNDEVKEYDEHSVQLCQHRFFHSSASERSRDGEDSVRCSNCYNDALLDDFAPSVLVVFGGGPNSIKTIATTNSVKMQWGEDQLMPQSTQRRTPIVVVEESGRAAKFMASVWRHLHEGDEKEKGDRLCYTGPESEAANQEKFKIRKMRTCVSLTRRQDASGKLIGSLTRDASGKLIGNECLMLRNLYLKAFSPQDLKKKLDDEEMKQISIVLEICRRKETVVIYNKSDPFDLDYYIMKAICFGTLREGRELSQTQRLKLTADWDMDGKADTVLEFVKQELLTKDHAVGAESQGRTLSNALSYALSKGSTRVADLLNRFGGSILDDEFIVKRFYYPIRPLPTTQAFASRRFLIKALCSRHVKLETRMRVMEKLQAAMDQVIDREPQKPAKLLLWVEAQKLDKALEESPKAPGAFKETAGQSPSLHSEHSSRLGSVSMEVDLGFQGHSPSHHQGQVRKDKSRAKQLQHESQELHQVSQLFECVRQVVVGTITNYAASRSVQTAGQKWPMTLPPFNRVSVDNSKEGGLAIKIDESFERWLKIDLFSKVLTRHRFKEDFLGCRANVDVLLEEVAQWHVLRYSMIEQQYKVLLEEKSGDGNMKASMPTSPKAKKGKQSRDSWEIITKIKNGAVYDELFLYAVLAGNTESAYFFFKHVPKEAQRHCITRALFACALARKVVQHPLITHSSIDSYIGDSTEQKRDEEGGGKSIAEFFEEIAHSLMTKCYEANKQATMQALTEPWVGVNSYFEVSTRKPTFFTPLRLVPLAQANTIIQHEAFQECLNNVWMGYLIRDNKQRYDSVKLLLPFSRWTAQTPMQYGYILVCIIFFPLLVFLHLEEAYVDTAESSDALSHVHFGDDAKGADDKPPQFELKRSTSWSALKMNQRLSFRKRSGLSDTRVGSDGSGVPFSSSAPGSNGMRHGGGGGVGGKIRILWDLNKRGFHGERNSLLAFAQKFLGFHNSPVVKFMVSTLFYLIFLCIYTVVGLLMNRTYTIAEGILHAWIGILIIKEFRQMVQMGREEYFSSFGNLWDIFQYSIFLLAFAARMYELSVPEGEYVLGRWDPQTAAFQPADKVWTISYEYAWQDILQARALHGICGIFFWARLLENLRFNSALGPLILVMSMLWVDVYNFMIIALLFMLSFGAAFICAYRPSTNSIPLYYCNAGSSLGAFYETYNACIDDPGCANQGCSAQVYQYLSDIVFNTYLQLLGEVNNEPPEYSSREFDENGVSFDTNRRLGAILFIIYMLIGLMLLNLLIAMFGRTYSRVEERSQESWQFQLNDIVLEYERAEKFPAPLSLPFDLWALLLAVKRSVARFWKSFGKGEQRQPPEGTRRFAKKFFEDPDPRKALDMELHSNHKWLNEFMRTKETQWRFLSPTFSKDNEFRGREGGRDGGAVNSSGTRGGKSSRLIAVTQHAFHEVTQERDKHKE